MPLARSVWADNWCFRPQFEAPQRDISHNGTEAYPATKSPNDAKLPTAYSHFPRSNKLATHNHNLSQRAVDMEEMLVT